MHAVQLNTRLHNTAQHSTAQRTSHRFTIDVHHFGATFVFNCLEWFEFSAIVDVMWRDVLIVIGYELSRKLVDA